MRRFIRKLFGASKSRKPDTRARLTLSSLEGREVPAGLFPNIGNGRIIDWIGGIVKPPPATPPAPPATPPAIPSIQVDVVPNGADFTVKVDGKVVGTYQEVTHITVSEDGKHYGFVGKRQNLPNPYLVVVDGANKGYVKSPVTHFALNKNGSHVAYAAATATGVTPMEVFISGQRVERMSTVESLKFRSLTSLEIRGIWNAADPGDDYLDTRTVSVPQTAPPPPNPGGPIGPIGGNPSPAPPPPAPNPPAPNPPANPTPPAPPPLRLEVVPVGNRVSVRVNGVTVGTHDAVTQAQLSPDGQHYAYVGKTFRNGVPRANVVYVNGVNRGNFNRDVVDLKLARGGHYAFVGVTVNNTNGVFRLDVVVNGVTRGNFNRTVTDLQLSDDGKHFGFIGLNNVSGGKIAYVVVVDGVTRHSTTTAVATKLTLSKDGTRHAFAVATPSTGRIDVKLDGRDVRRLTGITSLSFNAANELVIEGYDGTKVVREVVK